MSEWPSSGGHSAERPPPALTGSTNRTAATVLALVGGFGAFGFLFGIWQVALPDLTLALGLDEAELGAALAIGFLASFPSMWAAGRLVDRFGPLPVLAAGGAVMGVAFLVFALIPAYPVLVLTLLAFFGASGAFDIALNAAAVGLERLSGRHILTPLHAAFSGGAAVGAVGAGLLAPLGVPFVAGYLVVPVVLAAAVALAWRVSLPRSARGPDDGSRAGRSRRLPPVLLALGTIAVIATLSEGALESWSAIYLRIALGMPVALGAVGVATFHVAMVVGRLGGGRVISRLGRLGTLVAAGALAAVAMPFALATDEPALVLTGLFAVALGLSVLFPIAVSLAGDVPGASEGRAASTVITIGYAGFVAGPAIIGAVATLVSLRVALLVVALGGLVTVSLARGPLRALRPRRAIASGGVGD